MESSYKLKQASHDNYAFMSCVLRVDTATPGWQKTVMKVLNNIHGVYNFRMGQGGIVVVSGKVTPTLLLKILGKAGKKAEVLMWQFGECSSNLFVPVVYGDDIHYGGYGQHGYSQGYGSSGYNGYNGHDNHYGHGEIGYYEGYGGTNFGYGEREYESRHGGYDETNHCGDHVRHRYDYREYERKHGGTAYHGDDKYHNRDDHSRQRHWYNPFSDTNSGYSSRNVATSSRQGLTSRAIARDSEEMPSCCTLM